MLVCSLSRLPQRLHQNPVRFHLIRTVLSEYIEQVLTSIPDCDRNGGLPVRNLKRRSIPVSIVLAHGSLVLPDANAATASQLTPINSIAGSGGVDAPKQLSAPSTRSNSGQIYNNAIVYRFSIQVQNQ
jgi:hypothetical protein